MSLAKEISEIVKGRIKFNEPLSEHTSLRIGGPADYWVEPKDLEDLRAVLQFASTKRLPWKVLGEGTNILARDRGFPGLIISLRGDSFQKLEFNEDTSYECCKRRVVAGAAVLLSKLMSEAAERGLGGLEFAVGIPGTVGGALVMNAGAQSASVGDVTHSVKVLNTSNGVSLLKKDALRFGYRRSNLGKEEVVLEVEMKLKKKDKNEIDNLIKDYLSKRREAQPLDQPSAGCIFKNPSDVSAGELIDKANLKGRRIGDAQISTKHANFIINRGEAKAEEVISLVETVREEVLRKMGIRLEPEIEIIGE
ncbi:UDP-N-acetylmuramate dehydrogenase [candidate division NPL-UPA2 bacterium]|nr:UDP-N-acetylmuramate dehydrogenase [candidate division NPL-UPA2 bacterium]